jgi:diacylglycerol kinase (ATP)
MRVAAILGTKATARDLREFQLPGVEIVPCADLAADCACDAALIFGGDGSMHRQLSAAVASQVPLLCVPTGSGNDFARALGFGTHGVAVSAWRRFCSGAEDVRSIDVCEITFPNAAAGNQKPETGNSLYCCVAGVGLDSEVNRRANRLPAWLRGHGGYILSVPGALARFQAPAVRVELFDCDGPARIAEPAMLVAFANAPSYGHGMRIAPRALLDDGKLDVCFVRRASKLRLLRLFPVVFSGGHLDLPEVVYAQCSGLSIESDPPLDIFGDGEFIGRTPADIRVRPRALHVIVP